MAKDNINHARLEVPWTSTVSKLKGFKSPRTSDPGYHPVRQSGRICEVCRARRGLRQGSGNWQIEFSKGQQKRHSMVWTLDDENETTWIS